jgi:hypothetical protein
MLSTICQASEPNGAWKSKKKCFVFQRRRQRILVVVIVVKSTSTTSQQENSVNAQQLERF